jgi:integrase/recombinase XerC
MLKTNYKNRFLDYLTSIKGYSKQTIITYRIAIDSILDASDIDLENGVYVINLLGWRSKCHKQKNSTILKKLSAFRSFCKYLEMIEVKHNILGNQKIRVEKTLPKPIHEKYIQEAILSSNDIERLIVVLIYSLGVRISELENIKISDINNRWLMVMGKGNKNRQIPINNRAFDLIQEYINKNSPKIYLLEYMKKKLTQNQIRYKLKKLFNKHEISVTPHQLRHSFATDLINSGARINDVSRLLGHENLSTTQIYTKLSSNIKMDNYKKAHPLCGEII